MEPEEVLNALVVEPSLKLKEELYGRDCGLSNVVSGLPYGTIPSAAATKPKSIRATRARLSTIFFIVDDPPFVLRLICKASIFPISNSSVANDYHFQPMVPSPFLNYGNYRPFLSDILMTVLFCR